MGMQLKDCISGVFLLECLLIDVLCSPEPLKALFPVLCTQSKAQTEWSVLYLIKGILGASLMAQMVKNTSAVQETQV